MQAGDQSEYVGAVRKVLVDSGSRLGPNMPANYFRSGLPVHLRHLFDTHGMQFVSRLLFSDLG